jgi:hypothetical protein
MIDKRNGALLLANGVTLGPSLTVPQWQATPLGQASRPLVKNPPWESFRLRATCADGTPCGLVLYFHQGWLQQIQLGHLVDPAVDEREVLRMHDRWLRRMLGEPPYAYPWGSVTSSYDPRSDSSSVVVTYGEPIP